MEDILYKNSTTDIRIREMVNVLSDTDKELPNLIILTILSAGAGLVTPIFSNSGMGNTIFTSINEIGTKFILDGKEVTSDDFLVVTKSQSGINFNFFGLLFEDSNEHTLKVSLIYSTIPNFQRISEGPGYSANSITSMVISNSITGIDYQTFCGCTGLTSITIPDSVTEIGDLAFKNCTGLTSITIPNSVTSIGNYAFNGCTGLTSIIVDSGNAIYDSRDNCNAIIETDTNTLIYGCKNTIIPNSVTSIGERTFNDCIGLTSVTIPNTVTSIGSQAFNGCSGLTSVTIGSSVTSIGNSAFKGCSGLTSITSLATTAPAIQSKTFQDIKTNGILHIPAGSNYSTWMSTSNYYLGKYNWTKVEDA